MRIAFDEHPTIAGDLEAQQGWRMAERDEFDGPANRSLELDAERRQVILAVERTARSTSLAGRAVPLATEPNTTASLTPLAP